MTEFSVSNDLTKIKLMIEMFSQIERMNFETEQGIEFFNTINRSLQEVVNPYARDKYKQIEKLKNN